MSKNTAVFAKWNTIIELIASNYKEELKLPLDFISNYNEQFRILKNIHLNNSAVKELKRHNSFTDKDMTKLHSNNLQELIDYSVKLKGGLDENQFITVSNSSKSNFIWIDPRLNSVLDIPKKNFTINGILGVDKNLNLHHPMDVSHYSRNRLLTFFINSIKGLEFIALKDYFSIRFRIGQDLKEPFAKINSSVKYVEQKCYGMVNVNDSIHEKMGFFDSSYNMTKWTITDNQEKQNFVTVNYEFIGNALKSRFVNILYFIANAKLLGFNPKEVLVLHYLDLYDTTEESRSRINRQIRLNASIKCQFENKAFTDFSYLLNKKLTSKLKKLSLNSENNHQYFSSLNRLSKARRLGLLPLHCEIEKAILISVFEG